MEPSGEDTRRPETDRCLPVGLYLAPWTVVVLAALKLKHVLLVAEGGGYDFLAELLGVGNGGVLTLGQRLALFRGDFLAALVGGAVFLGSVRLLPSRLRAAFAWLTCTALFLIVYAQLKSWWEVGTFISAPMMVSGLLGAGTDLIQEYATSATMLRLLAALSAITGVCLFLAWLERRASQLRFPSRLRWVSWSLATLSSGLVMASWSVKVPSTPYNRAAATASMSALAGRTELAYRPVNVEGIEPRELLSRYARMANAPVPNRPSPYFGRARGYDVVFLLLESLPAACYALASSERTMPNVRGLERKAFVPLAHYSTYPYSRRAYSSIFSSWYPLNGIRGAMERYGRESRDLRAPGVVRSAALAGYETVAFVPERPVELEEDNLRYSALGFSAHEVPRSAYNEPEGFALDHSHRDWVRTRDRESFENLKESVARSIDAGQRYLYSFNPQLTHGPWPGLTSSSSREETCRAGLALFSEIDGMVGELVSLLRERQRFDSTLIVILGDHGLRTRTEYPPFRGGTLDDVTFRVPLVLHAPGILDSTFSIPWMTSHIDIAPSVLDLLGIDTARELELGSPMWEPEVADRTTFFFAKSYLGADGYQRKREAVMVRYLFGGVSRTTWNGALRFQAKDLLRQNDQATVGTVDDLMMMAAIQTELARSMLPSAPIAALPSAGRRANIVAWRLSKADTASHPRRASPVPAPRPARR